MGDVLSSRSVAGQQEASLPCVGCGGLVPEVQGPTHPYMRASPGCRQMYGEIGAREFGVSGYPAVHWHHVDCYAVQHPGCAEHDRRQRQSVAVHLTSLCLLLELGIPAERASALRARMSQMVLPRIGRADWPHLAPPASLGAVTVVDVHAATDHAHYVSLVEQWKSAAWMAWAGHHEMVHAWATVATAA